MEKIVINKELELHFPDGFHIMTEEERKEKNISIDGPTECISDPDRHAIINIAWKKSGLSALMLRTDEVAKNMEKQTAKLQAPFHYQLDEFVSQNIGDLNAEGFRYLYEVEDVEMIGTSLVVKKKKMFYFVHLYSRVSHKGENLPLLDEVLAGAKWS